MSFKKLSNFDLESQFKNLVTRERSLLHEILLHIKEVDRRKLYLDQAYPSLFEYLTKKIGYSASSAQRRIEAARLLQSVPELAQKIQTGSLNLTQVGEFSKAIKQKEKESLAKISPEIKTKLLAQIENKNFQETQKLLAQELNLELKPTEKQQIQKDESVHLQVTLTKEQYQKLIQCKDMAAHKLLQKNQGTGLAQVIEIMADQYLEKKLGVIKKTQDLADSKKTNLIQDDFNQVDAKQAPNCCGGTTGADVKVPAINSEETKKVLSVDSVDTRITKTLTAKTKRQILNQHKHCQYKDPRTGKICQTTFALEVDHKHSRWAGGNHAIKNLQVLCAQHNKFKYQRESQIRLV